MIVFNENLYLIILIDVCLIINDILCFAIKFLVKSPRCTLHLNNVDSKAKNSKQFSRLFDNIDIIFYAFILINLLFQNPFRLSKPVSD